MMFGLKYLKFQPSEYILRYNRGKLTAQGVGLSFICYLPTTSVAVLPVGSFDVPFIFEETTVDFQSITVQGELVYRIAQPAITAGMLNFTYQLRTREYLSDDPQKLSQRMMGSVKVLAKKQLERMDLHEAMRASESLASAVLEELRQSETTRKLGLEVLGLTLLDVRANKETARALEAQTREQILKTADDAVYERRNASIEQERTVKENEYNTEISVEQKKFQVREEQLRAEQAVQQRQNQLREEQLLSEIKLEEKRRELVELAAENARAEADAKAYALGAAMGALEGVDAGVIQSLASVGMQPEKLMALAFQGLAENAGKIGQLNITPDLLREILQGGGRDGAAYRE